MRRKAKRLLAAALAAVLCVSLGMLLRQMLQYREGQAEYEEAQALVKLPDLSDIQPAPEPAEETAEQPEETPEEATEEAPVYVDPYADALRDMDFTALREVNGDVLGWILIPGTAVSYPLVQGADNQYYLNHTWKKWTNVVGSIFLECSNSPDFSDFNTIIYGHRMNNGSMFASLKYYKQQSYWSAHPCVYITDDAGTRTYRIFAAYEVSTEGSTYQLGFSGDASKQAFLDDCMARSVIDTGIVPTVYDRILTLSTCTGSGHATRWVVQAVLPGEAPEEAAVQEAAPAQEAAAQEETPAQEGASAPEETPALEAAPAQEETPAPAEELVPAADTETVETLPAEGAI